ncbi:MAG: TonB-dependent receptor [Bacteroidia bacterium]
MLKKSLLFILLSCSLIIKAQDSSKVILSGSIKDSESGEALIGASIMAKSGVGAVADIEGNFTLALPKGDYVLEVSMLGYSKFTQKIKLYSNKRLEIKLENMVLDEVEVVADIAKIRETPVAFSSISATKIQEELGGKDISLIANTTPGAYATSQGGGAGDSRVTIRGFDQRNIGVLVDGVPVNDMENGQVYWSNWDGLKDITKSLQIQRGLGASKLAISSVGGTMNFITNGIDSKQQTVVKKEWGNNRANLMSLAYNSGLINNKWGFTLAGTYRNGDGWVEGTWYNAYSYFAKVQFMPNPRHIISLGINGAPQSHGSRASKVQIAVYDREYAKSLGINSDSVLRDMSSSNGIKYTTTLQGDRDFRWNPDLVRLDKSSILNSQVNEFHKPLASISHFWKISEKINLSSVAYFSMGTGGGANFWPSTPTRRDSVSGYIDITSPAVGGATSLYPGERKSSTIIRMQNNDHKWVGLLSTATTKLNKMLDFTYGLDLRYYRGYHYNTVYNLLGGDYYVESIRNPYLDYRDTKNFAKRKNDLFNVNYNSSIKWLGLFGQVEFKKDKWSAFFTATGSKTGFNRTDYYKKKDLIIDGHHFDQAVQFGETLYWNGEQQITAVRGATVTTNGDTTFIKQNAGSAPPQYILNATGYDIDSKEARASATPWVWQWGYTIKGGANYNINDHHNVFTNIGVMQIPQRFDNTISFNNRINSGFKPQRVQSYELGYGIKYNSFFVNVNGYYTSWKNQPQSSQNDANGNTYIFNGIDLIFKGIEFEANYKPIRQIDVEAILSVGDWRYNSGSIVYSYDANNIVQDSIEFDAKGVHVGNAAQNQIGLAVKYKPFKGFYFKPRVIRFDKNYANFRATDLNNKTKDQSGNIIDNRGRESWRMPAYYLCDVSAGYEIPFKVFTVNLYTTINNLFNFRYISDAQNNGAAQGTSGFNATSASVFFGVGRTFIFGTKLTF